MLKKIVPAMCLFASVLGCSNPEAGDLYIPAASIIKVKVWHIGDGFIANVVGKESSTTDSSFQKLESNISNQLAAHTCDIGFNLYEWKDGKHHYSNPVISCKGIQNIDVTGYIVDGQGKAGLPEIAVGDTLDFVMSEGAKISFN